MTRPQKDDRSWTDSTLCELSDRAYRLHDNCWTYCADQLTDGRLTRLEVARVAAMFGLVEPQGLEKAIAELLTSNLWKQDLTGFVIVDWLTHNYTRKQVKRYRKANREKQAAWRASQAAARGDRK